MFDGTIISKGNSSQGDDSEMVDVEDDETAVYGSPQYPYVAYHPRQYGGHTLPSPIVRHPVPTSGPS